jgi:hypothetical protein
MTALQAFWMLELAKKRWNRGEPGGGNSETELCGTSDRKRRTILRAAMAIMDWRSV